MAARASPASLPDAPSACRRMTAPVDACNLTRVPQRSSPATERGHLPSGGDNRGTGMRERIRRRMFPLIASAGLVLVGMFTTTLGPTLIGRSEWALPYDLWGTLIATTRLAHGNVGGLYAPPTGLISLPGAAVILLPVRRADHGVPPVAGHPRPGQPAPGRLAAGRAVSDRDRLPAAVRGRRPGRAARRAALDARRCWRWPGRASCGRSAPAGGTPRTRSRSGCCSTRCWPRATGGPRWRAGWPGRRSASSRWCCWRCRSCSPCCRGGGCPPFLVRAALPSAVLWRRPRSPTGTTPTSR